MTATERTVSVGDGSTAAGAGAGTTEGTSAGKGGLSNRFLNRSAVTRLRAELAAAEPEFELLVDRAEANGEPWAETGFELLGEAQRDLERGAIDESWRHLHTARRVEVYGLEALDERNRGRTPEPRSEVQIRAASVREEALDALGGWRRRAVIDLLCEKSDGTGLKPGITGSELRRASRILDEQYENVHLARSEKQRQFNALVVMGTLAGLALFTLSLVDWLVGSSTGGFAGAVATFIETPFGAADAVDITSPGFAVSMTVAGVLGAALFGMRSLRKQSLSTKIPQQVSQLTITSARGVVGAISALLFYFALQSPLLDGTLLSASVSTTPTTMVVVAFAAGYAERMAPNVVARVASITSDDESGGR